MRRLVIAALAALVLAPAAQAWTWPAEGAVLRPFSLGESPYAGGQHRGIDVGGEPGSTVRAAAGGTVFFAGSVPGNGKTVTIRTADGYSVTHLQLGEILVVRGAIVDEGAPIGRIGPSTDAVTLAAHVHLGVRVTADPDGYVDPLTLLPSRVASDPPAEEAPAEPEVEAVVGDAPEEESGGAGGSQAADAAEHTGEATVAEGGDGSSEEAAADTSAVDEPTAGSPDVGASSTDAAAAEASAVEEVATETTAEESPAVESAHAAPVPHESVPVPVLEQETAADRLTVPAPADTLEPNVAAALILEPAARAPVAEVARLPIVLPRRPGVAVPARRTHRRSSGAAQAVRRVVAERPSAAAAATRATRTTPLAPGTPQTHAPRERPHRATPHAAVEATPVTRTRRLPFVLAAVCTAAFAAAGAALLRRRGGRGPAPIMGADGAEDPGGGGVAVCGGPEAHRPRGRLRRPVRHLRAVPPAEGERRADGERDGRARDARPGGSGQRGTLAA
jgi:hypothetical protein